MLDCLAMFTVALISRKGGAGKTTLACGLAVASEQEGLVGPVQTIRDASPKAQHHFTHADQGEWLCAPNASPKLLWDG